LSEGLCEASKSSGDRPLINRVLDLKSVKRGARSPWYDGRNRVPEGVSNLCQVGRMTVPVPGNYELDPVLGD
jgi:hypothetical protein